MALIKSDDPRAVRTRHAIQTAFADLMRTRSYQKISVTDITDQAGIARHTFYNHYETKADLLDNMVDSILEVFFEGLDNWTLFPTDPDHELAMITAFFKTWRDHADIVGLLRSVDIELVLMDRLKVFFTRFFHERISQELPGINMELAGYVISFNSYSLMGLLLPWFESGLKHSPEDLAGFYNLLSDSTQRRKAVQRYQDVFR